MERFTAPGGYDYDNHVYWLGRNGSYWLLHSFGIDAPGITVYGAGQQQCNHSEWLVPYTPPADYNWTSHEYCA